MSEIEIITNGGRRRRWSSAEKLRIVEETLDDRASISVVARRNGVAANLLYRWRRLMLEGGAVAVAGADDVTSNKSKNVDAIVSRAHECGAFVVLDVYQSVGTIAVDAARWDVDVLLGGSIKWLCGGPACRYLHVRPDLVA